MTMQASAGLDEAARTQIRRAEVRAWAREALEDPLAVVFDTETTTLYGSVIEAVVRSRAEVVFRARMRPPKGVRIAPEATAVHHLTDADVARERPFAELWPELEAALSGRRIIAYKAAYDRDVLAGELHRMFSGADPTDLALPPVLHPRAAQWIEAQRWECAMLQFARWNGIPSSTPKRKWRNVKLPGGDHSAEGDCTAVWKLLDRLTTES
jgi:DNA polymerase-3 subunit epsilon